MQASGKDSPNTRRTLSVQGHDYEYFSLPAASDILGDISRLPMSLKVLLEKDILPSPAGHRSAPTPILAGAQLRKSLRQASLNA